MAPSPTCRTFSIASKAAKSRTLRSKPASRRPAPDKSQILHINAAGKSPGRRNPEPERGKGAESVFQGQMRRLWGVLASGLGSCLRTELRSLFRATQTFSVRQTFCSYRSLTSANSLHAGVANSLHTGVMQSAGQSCLPLTSVFCATSFRETRRRLNQVRTVFPTETVTTLDCELESRRPSVCVSGGLRTLLKFVRACLMFRRVAFQIAV